MSTIYVHHPFSQVAGNVDRINSLIVGIAAASNQQSQGIEQINKAVALMDDVVQQTAANAEESAALSQEMVTVVEKLENVIGSMNQLPARVVNRLPNTGRVLVPQQNKKNAPPVPKPRTIEAVSKKAKTVQPEKFIAMDMDESNFQDF